ncbi:MAG: AMP-binding protein [Clostridia bacterium]|nr:AMP-binding protein [Clostridia bacterium]
MSNVRDIKELNCLYEHFERGLALAGNDHPLYRFNRLNNKEDSLVTVRYGEYLPFLQKMTLAFSKLINKDDKVIVMGETTVQWITAYAATVTAGGVIVPLDPGILEDEIINFINVAEAKVVVYSNSFDKLFKERGEELKTVEKFVVTDKTTFQIYSEDSYVDEKYTTFNNILALGEREYVNHNGEFVLPEQDVDKMSILLFTSGTTGTSKGVMLSQKNIMAVMKGIEPMLNVLTKDDSVMSVLPIHHTYEMSAGILAPMIYGCTINISDGIKYVGKNIKQFKPTIMTLVPLFAQTLYKTVWKGIQKQGKEKTVKFGMGLAKVLHFSVKRRRKLFKQILDGLGGEIKYFIVGGAALNPEIVDGFKAFGVQVSQGYGITECAPLISVVGLNDYNKESCGKLMPGVEIRIDKENETDSFGEVVVKGDNVMLGYYNAPELTKEVLSEDGWFRTGDYGYYEKGYLYLTGRKKNIIIASNGKNVFPEEIEEYVENINLVSEVVVVGREGKEAGEVDIVAIVVPNYEECEAAGLGTEDEVIYEAIYSEVMKVNKKLVNYKHISQVEIRKEPFEKTAARKIKRFLIK